MKNPFITRNPIVFVSNMLTTQQNGDHNGNIIVTEFSVYDGVGYIKMDNDYDGELSKRFLDAAKRHTIR